jgi:hypothetical protein
VSELSVRIPLQTGVLQCLPTHGVTSGSGPEPALREPFGTHFWTQKNRPKVADLQGVLEAHRYRDSNPGFRTENPIREANFG